MNRSRGTESGIAPWADVFRHGEALPGQVFALEILERPVVFERVEGRTAMHVDRRGCSEGIYTTRGKGRLVERSVGRDVKRAQEADKAAHRFLLGQDDGSFKVEHDGLRWASGGVLSIVSWRGREWTPFFFRDIPPFGWNISLGGSDKGDDLTRPEAFLEREFLEEMLVLNGDRMRPFVFGRAGDEARARECAHEHLQRRAARDNILVNHESTAIEVAPAPTNMSAEIRDRERGHSVSDVLVCINRLEAAIEVVRPLHYALDDDDYILDGELLEPAGSNTPADLIRMPVAMISHDYLRRAFGPHWSDFEHTGTVQPSVTGPRMGAGDIVMFEPDVIRRRNIRRGEDPNATPFERQRYADWTKQFGENFYDAADRPTVNNPSSLFTLPAAKVVSYYFAHSRQTP